MILSVDFEIMKIIFSHNIISWSLKIYKCIYVFVVEVWIWPPKHFTDEMGTDKVDAFNTEECQLIVTNPNRHMKYLGIMWDFVFLNS